jgi:V8-like Glu-specific endopeptidase
LLSGNESTVWTAGHCVHGGGAGATFATNWMFVPAYKDGARPYGNFVASKLFTTDRWASSRDFGVDLGAAKVAGSGASLTDTIGGRGIAFDQARQQTYRSYGYPAASPFNGQRLWYCEAAPTYTDSSASPATMGIPCDMTGGSSGGGWVVGSNVLSVNSYTYKSVRNVMFGPYQSAAARTLYTAASSG